MKVGYSSQIQCPSVVYFKLHETKRQQNQSHFLLQKKQTGLVLITNCVNLLTHSRTASGIWDCLYTQCNIFANRYITFSLILLVCWGLFGLWLSPFRHCTASWRCTALQSHPSCNMPLLRGILSLLPVVASWSASSGRLYLSVITVPPFT